VPNITTHRAELDAGHLYVHLPEGVFLLDTGSHGSFGDVLRCTFGQDRGRLDSSMMGISMQSLRGHVRKDCVGLLGMDVLAEHPMLFDLGSSQIHVGDDAWASVADSERSACEYRAMIGGVPAVALALGGRDTIAIFDTGAQYGYVLQESQCAGAAPSEPISDFSPLLGDMSSPSWEVDVDLCPRRATRAGALGKFRQRVGVMPPLGGQMLSLIGVRAIIGCGWMRQCRVGFHGAEGEMWLAHCV
jgi:hypothetical protein